MKVYLVYETDAWLSYSSQNLIAVCTSYEDAVNITLRHAERNNGALRLEYVDEDDYDEDADYVENIEEALEERNQYNGHGFGYYIDEVETGTIL